MAVTIAFTADWSQLNQETAKGTANLSAAFAGIQAQMKAMETASGSSTTKMVTGLQQMAAELKPAVFGLNNLGTSLLKTGQAAGATTPQLQKLSGVYGAVGDAAKKAATGVTAAAEAGKSAASGFAATARSFAGLAATFGVGLSIGGLVEFTKSIVEAGIANERLMLSLKGAFGSAKAAGEAYQFVEQVANRLGIGLQTAVESFAKLSAATQGTVVQGQQTRDLFIAISEASRVMGLTTAETGGVVTALTQIIGKNTVSMEELRQQLGERLPQALRLVSKEMGVSTATFVDMVSKGQVLAQDFIPAMTRALQQMGKEAPAAAQSVQAALERVGNAWMTLKVTIAQSGLLELVARTADEMTRIVNQVTNWINRTKRMAGEMGLAPMVAEMQRLTQSIQAQQEILKNPNQFEPILEQARNTMKALESQRDALAQQIEVKQRVFEQDQKIREAEEAQAKAVIDRQASEDKKVATLRDLSKTYTGLEDSLKGVRTQLEALRSFDVPSLQAMQVDPFGPDFERRFKERETALLKEEQDLLDKRAGLNKGATARAVQEAGQSAVEIAKAREDALATSLKREEAMIKESANEQRRIADETAAAELAAQGPGAVEAIAAKRLQELRRITVEEATLRENARMTNLDQDVKFRELRLQAEIAGAGKNFSAATKAQEELKNLAKDTEAERVTIREQTEEALQKVSKKSVDDQITQARELNKIIKETEQDRLKARIDLTDEQINLIKAQVDGEVLTVQEGNAQIFALEQQRFANVRLLYEQQAQGEIDRINDVVQATKVGSDERVAAEAFAVEQIRKVREGLTAQLQAVNLQQQTQAQEHQNDLLKGWREWVRDVRSALGDFLFRWMDGQVHSMKEVLLDLKSYFFRLIADMIAYAATKTIVIPIVTAVIGGIGGGGALGQASGAAGLLGQLVGAGGGGGSSGGGLLDTGGTALTGLGLAKQLYSYLGLNSLTNYIGTGLSSLKETFLVGIDSLFKTSMSAATQAAAEAAELAATGSQAPGGGAAAVGASQAGTALGIAGGLAALGAGIYGALNASNNAAKAAYAASAAAGAAAAVSAAAVAGLLGASAATAVGTGWTGIGLIVAAVMAVIGLVLDRVIKPAGPNLAVGQPGGVGVGVEGGQLVRRGGVTSRVIREEGVSPEQTGAVQQSLNEGLTAAVDSILKTINAVALNPEKLLGPTQAALEKSLSEIQTINSASAKHMEKDIAEQLRFANVALIGGMLEPINMAFEQLIDSDLKTQLDRLPATTIGLTELFKQLNTQLDEMAKGENRDVLGQIQGVREQLERFGTRLARTAGQTAEQIVNGVIKAFDDAVERTQPLKLVSDFSHNLATLITTFNERMTEGLQALVTLQQTQKTLEDAGLSGAEVGSQVDRLTAELSQQGEIFSTRIVSDALQNLATELDKIVIQPIRIQATTVDALFTDSLAALNSLWLEWHRLESVGIDATRIQEQFTKLLGGALESAKSLLTNALAQGTFPEFLDVLLSIPDALAKMNPVFERLKALGQAFASVVGPIQQAIQQGEEQLRTPQQRMENTAAQMDQLEAAIADAGTAAEKALPLYAQLAQAITANAAAQIAAVQQVGAVIEQITGILDARGGTSAQLARVNQRINTAPGGGQGSIENISTLVTLYGQQLDLLAQLRTTIEAGLESIDETLRADESVSARATRLVTAAAPRPGATGTAEDLLQQASALQAAVGAVRELIQVLEQGLENIRDILHANETITQRATRLLTEVTAGPQPQTAEGLIDLASAMGDALGAIRALIDMIEQGLDGIRQSLQANETVAQRVTRLMAEVTTGPQPQTTEGLIELAGAMGDALGAIRELINMIEQGLEGIRQTLHANETVSARATRLVSELRTPAGDARDPAVLIDVAGQIGEALTAVRALMDLLRSGIESIDQTLFSLLSVAQQASMLQGKIAALNQQIATAGQATPEQLIELVGLTQQSLSLQQQMTQALQSTLEDLKASVEGTGPPVETITTARAQVAALQSLVDTGQATPEQLQQLVDANQQLLDVGRQFDLLDVQQEALDNLKGLAPVIEKQIEDSQAREQLLTDSLVGIKGALEAQVIAAQTTETALMGVLTTIEGQLVSALAVAVETETWLITQLTVIQQWLEAQLITARTTEQWLISQLTVIQQWLQFQLTAAQATETALVLQLLSIKGALDAQLAQIATAEAITIHYLDAQLIALNAQLLAQYGTTDVQNIIKQIQEWQLDELRDLNTRLKGLFLDQPDAQNLFGVQHELEGQSAKMDTQSFALSSLVNQTNTVINKLDDVNRSINSPLRTTPAQSGGWLYASLNRAATGPLGYARGGMVSAILEPGEHVFPPPFTSSQKKTLTSMNSEFPRFARGGWTVPGSGSGDSVPAMLPSGSFVLNRRASRAAGYQAGGPVQGSVSTNHVTINIQVYQQPGQSGRELVQEITKQLRREFRTKNDDSPFR